MSPDKVIEEAMKAQGWLRAEENPIPANITIRTATIDGITYYKDASIPVKNYTMVAGNTIMTPYGTTHQCPTFFIEEK